MITWTLFVQSILTGLTNGFVYALIGLGLSVVFRGSKIINAMQGEFALIAGIVAYVTLNGLGLPSPLAFAAGVIAGGISGWLMELLLISPARRRGANDDTYLLVTLGAAFAISAAVLYFFGRDSRSLTGIGGDGSLDVFDAAMRIHSVWLIVISIAVVLMLQLFYRRTALGTAMMAASIDPDGASTIGIDVGRMRLLTFVMGGAVGGLAGVLVAPLITIQYQMGLLLTLKGFAAAILGGMLNPFGAVVGGLVLGLVESLAVVTISSGYKDVISMSLLILIMIVLPNGILGRGGRRGG
ncbi:branched-chain amino acid ABC transporter permease [Variovorax boronicumulans]|uniref:branched-chain amino acid ABC transporter permease n=1 Tax=Variovorax boronicumulans TaxID=436515 RepID=UPI00214ACEE1